MSLETDVTLEIEPESRVDVINVRERIPDRIRSRFSRYSKAVYYSYHTTAGYFGEKLSAQLNHSGEALRDFVQMFQTLFPSRRGYRHDQMELRTELSREQKVTEPHNADSHLTFISSGLTNCATYENRDDTPVYFVDLDGIWNDVRRRRRTTVLAFNEEQVVARVGLPVPVSRHPIDSINLMDPNLGFFSRLQDLIREHQVDRGRIDISLAPEERNAGLTVNEYETLLMQHDLARVLRNPLHFMAKSGRQMLGNPRAIPGRARDYAKYDLVQVINQTVDALGLSESVFERLLQRFVRAPADHFLGMDRSLILLVSNAHANGSGRGSIVNGIYQSPILVQWDRPESETRRLEISLVRFD